MKVSTLADLKKNLVETIKKTNSENSPKIITYSRGMEFPKFKVTIEYVENDIFIDSRGIKWVKENTNLKLK